MKNNTKPFPHQPPNTKCSFLHICIYKIFSINMNKIKHHKHTICTLTSSTSTPPYSISRLPYFTRHKKKTIIKLNFYLCFR